MAMNNQADRRLLDAISEGSMDSIKAVLFTMGTSINGYRGHDGSNILHLAATKGTANLVEDLLKESEVLINLQREVDGSTPLHLAAMVNNLAMVEHFLAHPNIDDSIRDSLGRTPIDLSTNKVVTSAIEQARKSFIAASIQSLHEAVKKESISKLMSLVQTRRVKELVDFNALSLSGETLLHRAVATDNPDLVNICLKIGCDPFRKNRKGKLPMELSRSEEIRKLLREAPMKATPELKCDTGDKTAGYLHKYVNFATGYKKRYVVLEDGMLLYYKSREDYPSNCRGNVNIQNARLVIPPGDRMSFELRTSKFSLYFRADSEGEAARWILALSKWQDNHNHDDTDEGERALNAADTLRKRSQSSIIGNSDYRDTLKAAQECLRQLELHIHAKGNYSTNQTATSLSSQSASELDPVCQPLIQSLVEFFHLCEEREQYWQGRIDTEIRQRAMVEEALRRIRRTEITSISVNEDEFYDAFDSVTLSDDDEEVDEGMKSSSLDLSQEDLCVMVPPPVEEPVETLEELRIPERAVPATDLDFVATNLCGYNELKRDHVPVDSTSIPPLSIWNIVKNAIGKDLTRIPVPVNFSEPISMLQRLAEDLEYADLLYLASTAEDPLMRLQYVAAFAVSSYSSTDGRVSKPFNPLLGETFEYVSHEHAFRYISEQVSHHPPISACYCESARYVYYSEVAVKTKFLKSLELVPDGVNHVILKETNEHYSWRKITTAVYNLIMGKMWLDHYGTLRVTNHKTGDFVDIEFKATGWRTSDPRKLEGTVFSVEGEQRYQLEGYWHRYLQTTNLSSGELIELWRRRPIPPWSTKEYNFTYFTMALNEINQTMSQLLAPTDSRLRPDQKAMEEGRFDEANDLKVRLEEKQRARRKVWEAEEKAWTPRWFQREVDSDTGEGYWKYKGGYWESRERGEWNHCLDIYLSDSQQSSLSTNEENTLDSNSNNSL